MMAMMIDDDDDDDDDDDETQKQRLPFLGVVHGKNCVPFSV